MRTTVTLNAGLLEEIKRRASARGTTISRLIEDSVRLAFSTAPVEAEEREPFELVTYGKGGTFTGFDMDKTSALLELDDLERYGRAGR